MTGLSQEDRENAVYVLPEGYSESEFELSEEQIAFDHFKTEATDNEHYSKMIVSRVPMNRHGQRGSQKLLFLFECAVDEFTFSQLLSKLRDEYGSGFYKIQGRNEKGQLKLNKTVAVEAPKNDTATASADSGQGAVIEQISTALREHAEQQRDLIQSMMPAANPMSSMKDMFETMGAMMGAMGIERQPAIPPKTLMETLTEAKIIKEFFGSDAEDALAGGEANLYSLLSETVKAFGGPIAAAIAAGAQSGELNEQGLVALNAPKTTELGKVTEQQKHDMEVRKTIHILIQNAKTGIPPDAFAQILVNNTPEEKADELFDFISAEKCVDRIIQLEPAAEPYREWFDALRLAVIEIMAEPDDPAEDELGTTPQGKELTEAEKSAYAEAKELQDADGEGNLAESQTVAGDEDEESESSGTGDGDTTDDT